MTTPTHPTPTGRAFSLVELLVVLAILVMIVGVSWPALQKPWRKSRLRSAAKQLQSELGRARVAAIESGGVLQFRYQPDTARFAAQPGMTIALTADSSLNSAALSDSDQQHLEATDIDELEIEELPGGVIFQDPRAAELDGLPGDSPTSDAGQMPWSKPITFYPNGRVTGGRFRLADRHGYYVDVTLRGLTGTAKIGPVTRRKRTTEQDDGDTADSSGELLPLPPEAPAPLKTPAPLDHSAVSGGS